MEMPLKRAILLSIGGHLLLCAVVSINLGSIFPIRRFPPVYFLGPILESSNLEKHITKNLLPGESYRGRQFRLPVVLAKDAHFRATGFLEKEILKPNVEPPGQAKWIPNRSTGAHSIKVVNLSLIEGPARNRKLIYRPNILGLSWGKINEGEVELKILISPEGQVVSVERIASSGNYRTDVLWMRYIKGWQFVPEPTFQPQWGKVRLRPSVQLQQR